MEEEAEESSPSQPTASTESVVPRSWSILQPSSEILVFMIFGVVGTMLEVTGYWPEMRLTRLVPETLVTVTIQEVNKCTGQVTESVVSEKQNTTDLQAVVYKVADGLDLARFYSVHIYLAAYILLPYPLLTERQRVLLVPWLLFGVLRSIVLNLLLSLSGIVLCASLDKMHNHCLKYVVVRAAEFCTSLFVWTAVHNFYYYLDRKRSERDFNIVLETIHKAGMKKMASSEGGASLFSLQLLDDIDDDTSGTEATLVERAAMAWIAREILDNSEEYMADGQFSEYLAIKATMELRLIIKELAEKKRDAKRLSEKSSKRRKIEESLEFLKPKSSDRSSELNLEAFELSRSLSRRDPIRKIPPLISQGKPFYDDSMSLNSAEAAIRESLIVSTSSEADGEAQTDPLSPEMESLFNVLEKQYAKNEKNKMKESKKSRTTSGDDKSFSLMKKVSEERKN